MNKYRIVEETGKLTNKKRFYIEYSSKNIFGKVKWKTYRTLKNGIFKNVEFDDIKEAKKWINYWSEKVSRKYHYADTTDK
jgi:hypothetical protein